MGYTLDKGKDYAFIESIKNIMNGLHVSMDEAMDLLNVPLEKREKYAEVIKE